MYPQTYREKVNQPYGFSAVTREAMEGYGDSRNFFVNPDHVQATDLGNTGENPGLPLATADAAVTLARAYSGDTIYVMSSNSWQYSTRSQTGIVESLVIPATKPGIRIVGVGFGGLPVYWQPAVTGDFCISVYALDVVIENFCFWGDGIAANGIYAEWDGVTMMADNVVIRNCVFSDGIDIGIQLEYAWYCVILDCLFDGCDTVGFMSDTAGSGTSYNKIHDNHFNNCALAMSLLGGADDNFIFRNAIYNSNAQGAGVATDEGIDTTGGQNNQVYDNYFSCLLTVPANGDYADLNSSAATDAWINNHCMNGDTITNP